MTHAALALPASPAPSRPPVPVIETTALSRLYRVGKTEVHALQAINLCIRPGEFVALMGASGSGKSTLLHILGCLDTPTSGRYLLNGLDVSRLKRDERARVRNRQIGFVFQNFNLLPRMSALENVVLPLRYRGKGQDIQQQARKALARVGLQSRALHQPNELSGGERQRVAIARALVIDPAIILADEPTGSLDSRTGADVMRLLGELWRDGRTIILVTHDPQVAAHAQRILYMKDGALLGEEGTHVAG